MINKFRSLQMKSFLVSVGVAIAATHLSSCKPAAEVVVEKKPEVPVSVKLVHAKRGDIIRSVSLPANMTANQQVTLYSKVGGYLKQIGVDRGDEVNKGDLIAEIEVPEMLAELARNKAELKIAELDQKRIADAQKKAPDLIVLQSIDTATAKVEMARANLDRIETLLSFCKITAPFSGVVTRRMVDIGAFVPAATSGSAAQNAAIVTISDFSTVRVMISVPELEAPLIKKGLPVKVSVEGLPGQVFEGSVTRYAHTLDDATKTMVVEVDLPNPKRELRPGMFVTARIGVEKRTDRVLLPVEAVMIEKSGPSIFTVADKKAKKTAVKIGFNDGANIEIVEGVQAGDPIVAVGKLPLANGQAVVIADAK